MNESDLSLDTLLQETLTLTEYLRVNQPQSSKGNNPQQSFLSENIDEDYLYDLADSLLEEPMDNSKKPGLALRVDCPPRELPQSSGIIYKIDNGSSTFCVRGFSVSNIRQSFSELEDLNSAKRIVLKMNHEDSTDSIEFFATKNFELAEAIREQIINRRFPHQEDSVCNISDPGFSWWMNLEKDADGNDSHGRFEIFFRSHGINRAEKYIQLGPIGDGGVAAQRMNQARTLLRSSFPISEFSCDDKSFTVASLKPEHSSFLSFKNIFIEGVNHTELENFPDNSVGRTLFYYFHELAIVRKFWIEVKSKLG
jgi:hypothetical protein